MIQFTPAACLQWLRYLGIYGLSQNENSTAKYWEKIFNYIMIAIAIGILYEWQANHVNHIHIDAYLLLDWSLWCFFITEFLVLLKLVDDKKQYFLRQWMILVIVILGIPILIGTGPYVDTLRNFRPLLSLFILILTSRVIISFFIDGRLYTTIIAAAIIVLIFGIFVAGIDPNITTVWDGIWWAVATVSTVGYGDIVPASLLGRLLGCILVLVGIGVFVVLTANFLKLLLRKESEMIKQEEHNIETITQTLEAMQQTQEKMTQLLEKLQLEKKQGPTEH